MKKLIFVILILLVANFAYAGSVYVISVPTTTAATATKVTPSEGMSCLVSSVTTSMYLNWIGTTASSSNGYWLGVGQSIKLTPHQYNALNAVSATATTGSLTVICD